MLIFAQGPYGFMEIDDKEDAEDAIKDINGKDFNGGRIKVEFSYAYSGFNKDADRERRRGGGGGGSSGGGDYDYRR